MDRQRQLHRTSRFRLGSDRVPLFRPDFAFGFRRHASYAIGISDVSVLSRSKKGAANSKLTGQ
jgi:hypothetical protein